MREARSGTRVLAVSSQVVYGPVGNSAAIPAMETLGLSVLGVPTVLLSNHPGHGAPVRQVIAADTIEAMLETIAGHGWLDGLAGVMTGYFVDAAQVEVAAAAIDRLKRANPGLVYLCDPIIGDDNPGLYVPEDVADALCARLVPLADILTPNRFELAWLTGAEVAGPETVVSAARGLAPLCLATSVPVGDAGLANMLVGRDSAWLVETTRRAEAPHGTGDLLSGLFLGHVLGGRQGREALALAVGTVEAVLDATRGSDALDLAGGLAAPGASLPVRALEVEA
ncbi:MAG: pyridoxal kinase [Hyphomicrobiales bacterium]